MDAQRVDIKCLTICLKYIQSQWKEMIVYECMKHNVCGNTNHIYQLLKKWLDRKHTYFNWFSTKCGKCSTKVYELLDKGYHSMMIVDNECRAIRVVYRYGLMDEAITRMAYVFMHFNSLFTFIKYVQRKIWLWNFGAYVIHMSSMTDFLKKVWFPTRFLVMGYA